MAREVGASRLEDEHFGWRDLRMEDVDGHARNVQERIDEQHLRISVDYRPHDNLERLNAQIRSSALEAGTVDLDGVPACGFRNRWGDGVFTVARELDGDGRLVRVRLDVGDEKRQQLLRRVRLRSCYGMVSRRIVDDGEPIRFADREKPTGPEDSGWSFYSGTESQVYLEDPRNCILVGISTVLEKFANLAPVMDAPVGSKFRLEGDNFVPEVGG